MSLKRYCSEIGLFNLYIGVIGLANDNVNFQYDILGNKTKVRIAMRVAVKATVSTAFKAVRLY